MWNSRLQDSWVSAELPCTYNIPVSTSLSLVTMRCETVDTAVQELTLICIHTQPKSANKEIDRLYDVHSYVSFKQFLTFITKHTESINYQDKLADL